MKQGPREFESQPEWHGSAGSWTWSSKITVNPKFIASVAPYADEFSQISLVGCVPFVIRAAYDDVVAWWLEAIDA